jgi:diguanylate cyclase (GGDEF)-like protein
MRGASGAGEAGDGQNARRINRVSFSVLLLVLGVVFAIAELAVGIGIGWWVRGDRNGSSGGGFDAHAARDALLRLRDLTHDVADSVGTHAERMEKIGEQLAALSQASHDPRDHAVVDAVAQIVDANERMQNELGDARRRIQEQSETIDRQAESAGTDPVTGLPNRKGFEADACRRFAQWQQQDVPLSVLMIDVDNIAQIQQEHGADACDSVLRGVADILCKSTRDVDVVARQGESEFAVMLPGSTLDEAKHTARRLCTTVAAQTFHHDEIPLQVTLSEGVVEAMPGDDLDSLLRRADTALDASHKAGNNCAHAHDGAACQRVPTDGAAAEKPSDVFNLDVQRHAQQIAAQPSDARIDSLTGLLNRRALVDFVRTMVSERSESGNPLSLVLVDVDLLQSIHQRHGQLIGDVVLRAVSQILDAATRDLDQVGRYDGSTLALVAPGAELDEALVMGERIRRAVSSCTMRASGANLAVTVSVGVAELVTGNDSVALMTHAGGALKAAQIAGRNATYFWDPLSAAAVLAVPAAVR